MSSTHFTMDARIPWPSLVILVTVVTTAAGSAIEFTNTANPIRPPLSTNLTLRCSLQDSALNVSRDLNGTEASYFRSKNSTNTANNQKENRECQSVTKTSVNVQFATSMIISKNGIEVARLSEHFPAKSVIISPELLVTGNLSGQAGERGFLQLNWQHPTTEQAGEYKCDIESLDKQGQRIDFSTSLEIKEEIISMTDIITYVQKIEKERDNIEASLKGEISTLKQRIEIINSTTNQHVFFSAGLTPARGYGKVIIHGKVVVFDHVFSNVGNGYNPTTGIFTCPLAGFYYFTVNLVSHGGKRMDVYLWHNNSKVLILYSKPENTFQSVTNSITLRLQIRDEVKVVYFSGHSVWGRDQGTPSTFSGTLLAND